MFDDQQNKQSLRLKYRKIRQSVQNKGEACKKISTLFIKNFGDRCSGVVSGYLPIDSEVDALPLMMHFKKLKKKVVIPSIYKESLVFVDWDVESQFKYSSITCNQNTAMFYTPDLIITPLVAFDKNCMRLGFGRGYFDRLINLFRKTNHKFLCVGLAYQSQLCRQIPTEEHDQALDAVVTEENIYLKSNL